MTSKQQSPRYLDEAFSQQLAELLKLFISKHKDYGKNNILDTGELGVAFRINDKVKRLQNLLCSNRAPKNENIDDTWLDIAVYAVIAILLRKGEFEALELSEKAKKQ